LHPDSLQEWAAFLFLGPLPEKMGADLSARLFEARKYFLSSKYWLAKSFPTPL